MVLLCGFKQTSKQTQTSPTISPISILRDKMWHWYSLTCPTSCLAEKHCGLLLNKWNVGQQCTLAVVEISFLPACMSKIVLSRFREKFFLFSLEPEITSKPLWPVWPQITRKMLKVLRNAAAAGPKPNAAMPAYPGRKKAEGLPNKSSPT